MIREGWLFDSDDSKLIGKGVDSKGKREDFLLSWYWKGKGDTKTRKAGSISFTEAGNFTLEACYSYSHYSTDIRYNGKLFNTSGNYKTRIEAQHGVERELEVLLRNHLRLLTK